MIGTRFIVTLENDERHALMRLAEQTRRDPRQQAAILIRQSLEQIGLLTSPLTLTDTRAVYDARQEETHAEAIRYLDELRELVDYQNIRARCVRRGCQQFWVNR